MGDKKKLFDLMQAIGAIVEVSKVIYDDCLLVGYSKEQAFEMAKAPIQMAFLPKRNGEQED